jgi:hypothetical protein
LEFGEAMAPSSENCSGWVGIGWFPLRIWDGEDDGDVGALGS